MTAGHSHTAADDPDRQARFHLGCDSPGTRFSTARAHGRDDWPSRGFPATATPERISAALMSSLRSHPDIDHIVFTTLKRPAARPVLEAHLVNGQMHVHIAPLHSTDPHTRAIVHHLHAVIVEAFDDRAPTVEITLDRDGLHRWAQSVLAHAGAHIDIDLAHTVLNLLHENDTRATDTPR